MTNFDSDETSLLDWFFTLFIWWPTTDTNSSSSDTKRNTGFGILPYIFLIISGWILYGIFQNQLWIFLFALLIFIQLIFDFVMPEDSEMRQRFHKTEYWFIVFVIVSGLIFALIKYWPELQ